MRGLNTLFAGCLTAAFVCLAVVAAPTAALAQSSDLRAAHARVMQLYAGGRFADAIVAAQHALQLGTNEFGEVHPSTAALMANLGDLHMEVEQWPQAEALFRRVAAIRSDTLGGDHRDVADAYAKLGRTLAAQEKYRAAEDAFWQALATIDQEISKNPHVMSSLTLTAGLYRARAWYNRAHRFVGEDRLEEANALYESAAVTFEANQYVKRADVAEAWRKRAAVLRALGEEDQATTVEAHAVQVTGGRAGCRLPSIQSC